MNSFLLTAKHGAVAFCVLCVILRPRAAAYEEQLGGWVYTWPYVVGAPCRCDHVTTGAVFDTEVECLKSFARSEREFCTFRNEGISVEDCRKAASRTNLATNSECRQSCVNAVSSLIKGSASDPFEIFREKCVLELYEIFHGRVATLGNCFWEGVHAPILSGVSNVIKPVFDIPDGHECQFQCQLSRECNRWVWKALAPQDNVVALRPTHLDDVIGSNQTAAVLDNALFNMAESVAPLTCLLIHSEGAHEERLLTDSYSPQSFRECTASGENSGHSCGHARWWRQLRRDNEVTLPTHLSGPRVCNVSKEAATQESEGDSSSTSSSGSEDAGVTSGPTTDADVPTDGGARTTSTEVRGTDTPRPSYTNSMQGPALEATKSSVGSSEIGAGAATLTEVTGTSAQNMTTTKIGRPLYTDPPQRPAFEPTKSDAGTAKSHTTSSTAVTKKTLQSTTTAKRPRPNYTDPTQRPAFEPTKSGAVTVESDASATTVTDSEGNSLHSTTTTRGPRVSYTDSPKQPAFELTKTDAGTTEIDAVVTTQKEVIESSLQSTTITKRPRPVYTDPTQRPAFEPTKTKKGTTETIAGATILTEITSESQQGETTTKRPRPNYTDPTQRPAFEPTKTHTGTGGSGASSTFSTETIRTTAAAAGTTASIYSSSSSHNVRTVYTSESTRTLKQLTSTSTGWNAEEGVQTGDSSSTSTSSGDASSGGIPMVATASLGAAGIAGVAAAAGLYYRFTTTSDAATHSEGAVEAAGDNEVLMMNRDVYGSVDIEMFA